MKEIFKIALLFLLVSCLQETDLSYPSHAPQPVLNGILHPDSTLQVQLTWSNPLGQDTIYQVIENASIRLFENDRLIGEMTYQDSGVYLLPHKPIPLHTYRIEVDVPGQPLITAEDQIPITPHIITVISQEEEVNRSNTYHQIKLQDIPNNPNLYWLYGQNKDYKRLEIDYNSDIPPQEQPFYDCNIVDIETEYYYDVLNPPPFLDLFNATFQETNNAYEFVGYIRFTDIGLDGKTIVLNLKTTNDPFTKWKHRYLTNQVEGIGFYIHIINASTHYDRYLKSVFIQFINERGDVPNPFAEPTKIYSNVNNGLGIFAAYNSHVKKTHYKEEKLERSGK